MVVATDTDEVRQARKSMIELLLGNHPLDCPVCDAGGECELQDMTFKYGAAESRYMEGKRTRTSNSGLLSSFLIAPVASSATVACVSAVKVWTCGPSAYRTAARLRDCSQ